MKKPLARTMLALAACTFLGTSLAHAQATRTWVSGEGDDANPCSRTAPCKTFAGAISKTAAGGEISVLDPGGFGAVTITKSLTISGVGENSAITAAGTSGIIVKAAATDMVVLRNLQINGVGKGFVGIRFDAGGGLVVDQVNVSGFGTGIETSAGVTVVRDSSLVSNWSYGAHAKAGSLTLENSLIMANGVGAQASGPGTLRLANNSVYHNLTAFGCGGGALLSRGDNRTASNVGGTVPTCSPTVSVTVE